MQALIKQIEELQAALETLHKQANASASDNVEDSLAEGELRYLQEYNRQQLIKHAELTNQCMILVTRAGKVLYRSTRAQELLGYTPSSPHDENVVAGVHPADQHETQAYIDNYYNVPGKLPLLQVRARNSAGEWRWMEYQMTNLLYDPAYRCVILLHQDVTAEKEADEAIAAAKQALEARVAERTAELRATNARLLQEMSDRVAAREALENSEAMLQESQHVAQIGSWQIDLVTQTRTWSDETYRIFEQPVGDPDAPYTDDLGILQPEDLQRLKDLAEQAFRTKQPYRYSARILSGGGREKWFELRGNPVFDADGSPLRLAGTVQDITEEKLAGEALRASEERYKAFVQNAYDGIIVMDPGFVFKYISTSASRILGYPGESLMGQQPFDYLHPDDLATVREALNQVANVPEVPARAAFRWRQEDGSYKYYEALGVNLMQNPYVKGVVINIREIDARKRAEDALNESARRFRSLAENSPDIIHIIECDDYSIRYLNKESYLGWQRKEIEDADFVYQLVHPEDIPEYLARRKWLFKQAAGTYSEYEFRARNADGNWEWLRMREMVLKWDEKGRAEELLGTFIVVTKQKQTEVALRRSQSLYKSLLDHMPQSVVLVVDESYRVVLAGGKFLDTNAMDPKQMVGLQPADFVKWEEQLKLTEGIMGNAFGTQVVEEQITVRGRVYQVQSIPLPQEPGEARLGMVLARDVTDKRLMENALRRSEYRFRSMFESAPMGILLTDLQSNIRRVNPAFCGMLGYSERQLLSMHTYEIVVPDDGQNEAAFMHVLMEGKRQYATLVRAYQDKDGKEVWAKVTASVLYRDLEDTEIRILSLVEDITETRRAQDALQRSEERMQNLIRNSSDILALIDGQGRRIYVSPAVEKILGYTPEELTGVMAFEITHPDDQELVAAALAEIETGKEKRTTPTYTYRSKRKDGSWAYLEAITTNLLDDPSVEAMVLNLRDITERVYAQQRIMESLSEKEVLLQEIYHRVKNNLQVVTSLLEFQADQTTDEKTVAILQESRNRIFSMALVHEKLYNAQDLHRIEFDDYIISLTAYMLDAYRVQERELPIALKLDLTPVKIDLDTAMRCGLVLNELISNALKYAFADGREGEVRISNTAVDGQLAELVISDNGVGMPASNMNGTSDTLGLRLVQLVSRQLGATLDVKSEQGVTYRFTF